MRTNKEIVSDIIGVYCDLSPENLYCDGERSSEEVRVEWNRLHAKLRTLFKEIGREIRESEAYRINDLLK